MRIFYLSTFVALFMGVASCSHSERIHEHSHAEEGHELNDEDSEDGDEIVISEDKAEQLGIAVDTISPTSFAETLAVSAEVISDSRSQGVVVAPTSGRISLSSALAEGLSVRAGQTLATVSSADFVGGDQAASARIRLEAARKELERLKPLRRDGIVTVQEYNAAEQEYKQALNAVGAKASNNAVSPVSGVVVAVNVGNGQYVETGTPIAEIAGKGSVTLKVDLPKKYMSMASSIKSATFRLPYDDRFYKAGRIYSAADNNVASAGYIPLYFSIDADCKATPGTFAEAFLNTGEREGVIAVPVSAVTDRLGEKFVYVRLDEDCYRRCNVTLGATNGENVEVLSGLKPGDAVVTEGVTFVRLADNSGAVPEGHSHNH